MDFEDPLQRLFALQRDLSAFAEQRLSNVARLSAELDASIEDLRRLLEKKRKNEPSRQALVSSTNPPTETIRIEDVEYQINDDFRQAALKVADVLDLDELQAAKLCIDVADTSEPDVTLSSRALLHFHQYRALVLECVRLVLQQYIDPAEAEDDDKIFWFERSEAILKGADGQQGDRSSMWRKCIAGLTEVENYLKQVADRKQTLMMTGVGLEGDTAEALDAQRILLTKQHESLVGIMTILVRGNDYVNEVCFREFISKSATLEAAADITFHYLPVVIRLAARFGSDQHLTQAATSHELHKLFAPGPSQQQWRQPDFKAAAIICWLAEYSARFTDTLADPALRVADRQKAEQERSDLFIQCVKDKAFHFMLGACKFLKPDVWHDPAKLGLVDFLLGETGTDQQNAPSPSDTFVSLTMREFQGFSEQFVGNMPDVVRRLKFEEDDQRRLKFSLPPSESCKYEPDLERFIVIMSYAFQDDAEAAQEFWGDKEGNLHGFLRWASQRLPTPRVAAFCELLRSISTDAKSANQAHCFLLEDNAMVSGRLRKTYSVSWSQIFAELDTFATVLRDKPSGRQTTGQDGVPLNTEYVEGVETSIMIEAYLRLTAHICRESPDARNWLLREQPFHIGEAMLQLASSGIEGRLQASCFNMLAALLSDKVTEVNEGIWVMLDDWIAGGVPAGSSIPRNQAAVRGPTSERQYLQRLNDKPETATAFVNLLSALVRPSPAEADLTLDTLPFPENLGAPNRHAGIEAYVDFAVGTVFRQSQAHLEAGYNIIEIHILRYACLDFIFECLSSFNENLLLLANTTEVAVDAAIRTSSLATYARLHPFARVMEWLFNNNVNNALFASAFQDLDELNNADVNSPLVQATIKSIQVMNLAMQLQATYFDIVRPIIKTQSATRNHTVANAAFASFDDVVLSQLPVVAHIVGFVACRHVELSLETLSLLQNLATSPRLSERAESGASGGRIGNRLVGAFASSSDTVSLELAPYFDITEFDIENGEEPAKLVKARAVLDMLNANITTAGSKPTVAHCLLGFQCDERSISVAPGSAFESGNSLFHVIVTCAAFGPIAVTPSNLSWLLCVKRGCWDVILKLAYSPLTSSIVKLELQNMEPLAPASKNQVAVAANPLWDSCSAADPEALMNSAAVAVKQFLRIRELYFQFAALDLKMATETGAYSIQERTLGILNGRINFVDGGEEPTMSVFDLFDFLDLETAPALVVTPKYFADLDLSVCVRDDVEITTSFDLNVAEQLLILKGRELTNRGDVTDPQLLHDEIVATLASLQSQNNWRAIKMARLAALEAWTDLLSLMLTSEGRTQAELTSFALQGLQVILPKFEKSLADCMDAAPFLAKLTLAFVPAVNLTSTRPLLQAANAANERLLAAFRVCLKAITDSDSDLKLRDVCYRICCAVVMSIPLNATSGKPLPSPQAKQLLQLIQITGDRLMTVITEDTFSGRGSTRVAALLFLDVLVGLFQHLRVNASMLKALSKLNFIPVLIDMSIGSIASSFQDNNDELITTLSYFHTALALLLRICRTPDGTQLVLISGFFDAIRDSRLFSTDPDIGLDIENSAALREFYRLLSAVLRVITAIMITRGPNNASVLQQGKSFLHENRFNMQAVFKRTSALQSTSGPPEREAMAVADEFSKLMLVTGFLEDDQIAYQRLPLTNGFT